MGTKTECQRSLIKWWQFRKLRKFLILVLFNANTKFLFILPRPHRLQGSGNSGWRNTTLNVLLRDMANSQSVPALDQAAAYGDDFRATPGSHPQGHQSIFESFGWKNRSPHVNADTLPGKSNWWNLFSSQYLTINAVMHETKPRRMRRGTGESDSIISQPRLSACQYQGLTEVNRVPTLGIESPVGNTGRMEWGGWPFLGCSEERKLQTRQQPRPLTQAVWVWSQQRSETAWMKEVRGKKTNLAYSLVS